MKTAKLVFDVIAFPFYATFVLFFVAVLFTLNSWDAFRLRPKREAL